MRATLLFGLYRCFSAPSHLFLSSSSAAILKIADGNRGWKIRTVFAAAESFDRELRQNDKFFQDQLTFPDVEG
jgi:hypothetical protein